MSHFIRKVLYDKKLFLIYVIVYNLCSCNSNINEIGIEPYDENGVIKASYMESFYSSICPSQIRFYVESSGSMNGLFRSNQNTGFKHDVSALLLDSDISAKIDSVALFGNNAEIVGVYNPNDFRSQMNAGRFVSQASTKVPDMLIKIVDDLKSDICDVAVFISDMKYSPVGAGFNVSMGQYELDVEKIFSTIPDRAVSLISCESDYVAANGSVTCDSFPYYYVIIGEPKKVAWLRNEFISALRKSNKVIGSIDYAVNYGCPKYAALPGTSICMLRNKNEFLNGFTYDGHCSSFTDYTGSIQPAEVIIGVNYRHLPSEVLESLTNSDFKVTSHWGTSSASMSILEGYKPASDSDLVKNVNPNLYFKLTIPSLGVYDYDVIKIQLQKATPSNRTMEKYYGATNESELDRTVSIEQFIEGLGNAYPQSIDFQNAPITVFVTTKNN